MTSAPIIVGILAPAAETRELLRNEALATGMVSVQAEADRYCTAVGDHVTRRFVQAQPDIILADLQDPKAAIAALYVLHTALPETWLLVTSGTNDPQLIIDAMRAGAREFLPKPIPHRSLAQAFARYMAEKRMQQETKAGGKIYCVTSAKGGVGATSVAISMATCLGLFPEARVALIDLNSPIGDVAAYLNLKPQFTVSDALDAASRLDQVLLENFMSHAYGIAVLPGFKEFQPGKVPSPDALAKVLQVVAQTYTYSCVDLPVSFNEEHLQIVTEISAAVVVVLTPELPALWRTDRLIGFLKRSGGADKLRLLLNRNSKREEISEKEIEKALKHQINWRLPNNYNAAIRAINSGKPIVTVNHSALASAYYEVTSELTGVPLPRKRRLLGLFS